MPGRRTSKRDSKTRTRPRLLIVDEHAPTRRAFVGVFRLRGYECDTAATTVDAETAFVRFKPSVVIMEWRFRDGSGVGLAARLRKLSTGEVPIIIAVSTVNESERVRDEEGFDDYFTKPCDARDVEAAIKKLLQAREA